MVGREMLEGGERKWGIARREKGSDEWRRRELGDGKEGEGGG